MKKTVLKIAAITILFGGLFLNLKLEPSVNSNVLTILENVSLISKVEAEINPDCRNGCIYGNPTGCYCYRPYSFLEEYYWGD